VNLTFKESGRKNLIRRCSVPHGMQTRNSFTEAQRQELDKQRAAYYTDDARRQRFSQIDDGVMYNTAFLKKIDPCHRLKQFAR
jgi:hypothetical protein